MTQLTKPVSRVRKNGVSWRVAKKEFSKANSLN